MHPRNLYREAPDFIKLASEYPELKQLYVKVYIQHGRNVQISDIIYSIKLAPNGATIDYRNQSALRWATSQRKC